MKTTEPQLVASTEQMTKETFAKHFTHRHADSLGGISELANSISDRVERAYRSFHAQLHRSRIDLEHYHND
jgi:hypothetical protein